MHQKKHGLLNSSASGNVLTAQSHDRPLRKLGSTPVDLFCPKSKHPTGCDVQPVQRDCLEYLAADLGVMHVISRFQAGMNVRVVVRQKEEAAVFDARLLLVNRDRPLMFLESSTKKSRRALVIEEGALPSTEPSSATFLHGARCKLGSETVIRQLVDGYYVTADGVRKKDQLFFVTLPVRNTFSGHLLFLLQSREEVTQVLGVTALIQTYNDIYGNVF